MQILVSTKSSSCFQGYVMVCMKFRIFSASCLEILCFPSGAKRLDLPWVIIFLSAFIFSTLYGYEVVSHPVTLITRQCVTNLLSIGLAGVTDIQVSVFLYLHEPLLRWTAFVEGVNQQDKNICICSKLATIITGLSDSDTCLTILVSTSWWLQVSSKVTSSGETSQVLQVSVMMRGILSFDL